MGQEEDASMGAAAPGNVSVQGHAPRPPDGGVTVRTRSKNDLVFGGTATTTTSPSSPSFSSSILIPLFLSLFLSLIFPPLLVVVLLFLRDAGRARGDCDVPSELWMSKFLGRGG
eukprot:7557847-Pyramimonas_sp.AAC.1